MIIRDALFAGPLGFGAAPLGNLFRDIPDEEAEAIIVVDAGQLSSAGNWPTPFDLQNSKGRKPFILRPSRSPRPASAIVRILSDFRLDHSVQWQLADEMQLFRKRGQWSGCGARPNNLSANS